MTISTNAIRNAAETKPICRSDPEKETKKSWDISRGLVILGNSFDNKRKSI